MRRTNQRRHALVAGAVSLWLALSFSPAVPAQGVPAAPTILHPAGTYEVYAPSPVIFEYGDGFIKIVWQIGPTPVPPTPTPTPNPPTPTPTPNPPTPTPTPPRPPWVPPNPPAPPTPTPLSITPAARLGPWEWRDISAVKGYENASGWRVYGREVQGEFLAGKWEKTTP